MNAELHPDDLKFFAGLASAYQALCTSVTVPVSVPSSFYSPSQGITALSHVYWDAADNEDSAKEEMVRRIDLGRRDLLKHLKIHDSMRDEFFSIGEHTNTGNRNGVHSSVSRLCDGLSEYHHLVVNHKLRLGDSSFLDFPTCVLGHYFHVPGNPFISELSFNPSQDSEGLLTEIGSLSDDNRDFLLRHSKIFGFDLFGGPDRGHGIGYSSLRGRVDLLRELLLMAGMRGI